VSESTERVLARARGTIAVVGNGELRRDYGALIDAHDVVVRFNAFRVRGHQARCGRKTTHWVTFGETATQPLPPEHAAAFRPHSPFTARAPESRGLVPAFRARMSFARRDYRLRWLRRPSTGLMLLRLLESLGREADVFGFDGFATGHYFDRAHVHDPAHSGGEFLYLASRPCFRIYLAGRRPEPTLPPEVLKQLR